MCKHRLWNLRTGATQVCGKLTAFMKVSSGTLLFKQQRSPYDQYQSNHPHESDKTRQEQQDIANGYNQAFDDVSEIHAPPLA